MEALPLSEIQKSLTQIQQDLSQRLSAIEADLSALAHAAGKRRIEPSFIGLDEAARLSGRSKQGVQNLLKRERGKVNGFPVRVIHGGVHRGDFIAFLEYLAGSNPGRGAIVRKALKD